MQIAMQAPMPPALAALAAPPDENKMEMRSWQTAMQRVAIDKATLDSLVMNWLLVEGYQHVAEQFQHEAQIKSAVPLASIAARTNVRMSLSQGRIEEARTQIDAILPELLESRPTLLLQLQQQQLVELIRADRIDEALAFARAHLRASSAEDPSSLSTLESIMSLLAFAPLPPEHNPAGHLLDQRARVALAQSVNDAILDGQFASSESTLQRAAKHALHAQNQLAQFMHTFPKLPLDTASVAPGTSGASAAASTAASAALLDPASVFETLAQSEASARKASEEAAAAELAQVVAALERQRREKEEAEQIRRARQASVTAARASASRAPYRRDSSSHEEEEEEEEEEEDPEEEEHEEEHDEEDPESDDEDHNMASFV